MTADNKLGKVNRSARIYEQQVGTSNIYFEIRQKQPPPVTTKNVKQWLKGMVIDLRMAQQRAQDESKPGES